MSDDPNLNERRNTSINASFGHEKPCRTCVDFRTWMKMNFNKTKEENIVSITFFINFF